MGQTLAEVLRGHWCLGPDVRTSAPICRCEWRGERIHGRDDTWADQHAAHLADVVTAWLGTDAGREAAQGARNGLGASAGSEVDSGSTGDANGAQIGGMRGTMRDPYGKDFR